MVRAGQFDDAVADGDNRHVGLLLVFGVGLGQGDAHLQPEQVMFSDVVFALSGVVAVLFALLLLYPVPPGLRRVWN